MQPIENPRKYGSPPYHVAVIHGGPGAPGYMAPVARELSKHFGVIEPLQTEDSLDGQITELAEQLKSASSDPYILVGSSWGAVLALLTVARSPEVAKKLILIGSAVYDSQSSLKIHNIRMQRTPPEIKLKVEALIGEMKNATKERQHQIFGQINDLCLDGDAFDPITRDLEMIDTQPELNDRVWNDFKKLRDDPGKLASIISEVKTDTLIIHGDYDPHIIEGIEPFLKSCIPGVRLAWLEKCGHYPWIERHARDQFFEILIRECALPQRQ